MNILNDKERKEIGDKAYSKANRNVDFSEKD